MGRGALVTGATGFIGRNLVDELRAEGWQLRALVRPTSDTRHLESLGVELRTGDLRDGNSLSRALSDVDTVFHLAAVTAAHGEDEYRATNDAGTRALVAAAMAAQPRPRRLVYLSSYAAGGPAPGGSARSFADPPAPLTAYGRTKLAGELSVRNAETAGIEVSVIRAPVVYGPGDRALLPYFALIRWGIAPFPGGPGRRLHLIFAPDLARALRRAADAPPGAYAVAEPVEHLWEDVLRTIAAGLGRKPLLVPLPGGIIRSTAGVSEFCARLLRRPPVLNREKAEEMLAPAWVHELDRSDLLLPPAEATPLREGIDRTIRWYHRQGWL